MRSLESLEYSQRLYINIWAVDLAICSLPGNRKHREVHGWGRHFTAISPTKNTRQIAAPLTWVGFVGNLYTCKPEGSTFCLECGLMFGVLIELNWITRLLLNMQIWSYSARHITGQLFKVLLPTSRTRRKPSISLGEFRNLRNNRQPNWLSTLFLQTWSKRQTFKNSLSPPSNRLPFIHTPRKHLRRAPPSNPQSPAFVPTCRVGGASAETFSREWDAQGTKNADRSWFKVDVKQWKGPLLGGSSHDL